MPTGVVLPLSASTLVMRPLETTNKDLPSFVISMPAGPPSNLANTLVSLVRGSVTQRSYPFSKRDR
ncbi:hypothetical protein D3C79_957710 [compost metagenome]